MCLISKVMTEIHSELLNALSEKIESAENLISLCKKMHTISGMSKLQRKVEAELRFLHKLMDSKNIKEDHIRSSNLCHLSAIVQCCLKMENVVKVMEPFSYQLTDEHHSWSASIYCYWMEKLAHATKIDTSRKRVVVDVIADNGKTWIKVAAGNPFAILQSSLGAGKSGRKSIIHQVKELLECAKQNLYMFIVPEVKVYFAAGLTNKLKTQLNSLNVETFGSIIDENNYSFSRISDNQQQLEVPKKILNDKFAMLAYEMENIAGISHLTLAANSLSSDLCSSPQGHEIFSDEPDISLKLDLIAPDAVLNLDVSTMLAYVSNVTNGFCDKNFVEKILSDQAARERVQPLRPVFLQLFKGRKLICCETAYFDFTTIIATVAGKAEKERASELLAQVTNVPDNPSEIVKMLYNSGKIKNRSKIIFGTGDNLKAITVTSNVGFLRSAASQGVKFVSFVHESRALTECKELPTNSDLSQSD